MKKNLAESTCRFYFLIILLLLHTTTSSQITYSNDSSKPGKTKDKLSSNIFSATNSLEVVINELAFNATILDNNNTKLTWSVASENNLSHYEIEKSNDGINYYKTIDVRGQNLDHTMFYHFTDPDELNGTAYYRLKMVDVNGTSSYSNTITLNSKEITFSIKYVNNPFSNKLNIEYILPADELVKLRLFDRRGKLLLLRKIAGIKGYNSITIPSLVSYARGTYSLELSCKNGSLSKTVSKLN